MTMLTLALLKPNVRMTGTTAIGDGDSHLTSVIRSFRIVIAGAGMKQKAKNGGVFYFDKEYSLQPREVRKLM